MRTGRRGPIGVAAIAALVSAAGVCTPGAQIVRAEDAIVALFGLQTSLDVEQQLLVREEARYEANFTERTRLDDQLSRFYNELEALFVREKEAAAYEEEEIEEERPTPDQIRRAAEAKEMEVRALERALASSRDEGRAIRDEIRRVKARISILSQKIAELRNTLPQDRDSVTGIWDIALMPSGDRGVFALWQSGTMVSGQYVLDGPFRGSLEGTMINRQLLVRRIDATLGRSMEFSGYVSDDGQTVQGTWLNYNLSSGAAPTGSWSARKRSSSPSEAPTSLSAPEP